MSSLRAVQSANDALNRLGVDQSAPVDPFTAIEALDVELWFKPLETLLGAMLPGPRPGILINSARPAQMQRYTAAHELGHFFMGHDAPTLDADEAILGSAPQHRELEAQVFAANFLMPLELLHATARRYGIKRGITATPEQAYQTARDMRVSYEAAVRQMESARLLSRANADTLRAARPKSIKLGLADGATPPSLRGDVWLLDPVGGEVAVEPMVGDLVLVQLSERPSSGLRWMAEQPDYALAHDRELPRAPHGQTNDSLALLEPSSDPTRTVVQRHHDAAPARLTRAERLDTPQPIGGETKRRIAFAAINAGTSSVRFRKARRSSPDSPVERLTLSAHVRDIPAVESKQRWLAAFAHEESLDEI